VSGRVVRIKREASIANTPPLLEVIVRRIEYANKKYHSGTMWRGVDKGLAGTKLSTSKKKRGLKKTR